MKLKTITFFIINSILASAYARLPVGANSKTITSSLLAKNIQKIGDLDLRTLNNEIDQITWEISDQNRHSDAIARRSARYYPNQKKVQFFADYDTSFADQTSILELHEALGALGYQDEDHSMSVSLDHLNKINDPLKREKLGIAYGEIFFQKDKMKPPEHGGSSVGGGGDLTSVILKSLVLEEIDATENPDTDFYIRFASLQIEPVGGFQHFADGKSRIFFELKMDRKPNQNGANSAATLEKNETQEKVTIFFPGHIQLPGEKQDKVADLSLQIKSLFIQLYPVSRDASWMPVSVDTCGTKKTLLYPNADSLGIVHLQHERTEFLVGCDRYKNKISMRWAFSWIWP